MSHEEAVIQVNHLGKCYKLYDKPIDLALDLLKLKRTKKEYWALRDVNFSVNKGEVVGILGLNGAGKSTLLKILSGKLEKTTGDFTIKGNISSILELGTGFHPQYSGRENIVMGGMCLGLSRKNIEQQLDWIIEFSGLERVIDQPFHTYSSGMQARLTFATAVSINPDVFIVDEALATGDAFFAQKCLNRIREICKSGTTALFVSHATHAIVQLCTRVIWIDQGRVRMDGSAVDVVRAYECYGHEQMNADQASAVFELCDATNNDDASVMPKKTKTVYRKGPYHIDAVEILNADGDATQQFLFWQTLRLRVTYSSTAAASLEPVGLAAAINRQGDFLQVMTFNTNLPHSDDEGQDETMTSFRSLTFKRGVIEAEITPLQLTPGRYYLSLGILKNSPDCVDFYEYRHFFYELTVLRSGYPESAVFYPLVKWTHQPVCKPLLTEN